MSEGIDAAFQVPDIVRNRAENMGEVGREWLASLPSLVPAVAAEWGLAVGMPLSGGSAGFVAPATLADGTEAILKLAIPGPDDAFAPAILDAANGRGYVKLQRRDDSRKAMLLERLGPSLDVMGLPVEWEIRSICATHLIAWQTPPPDLPFTNGAQKAEDLASFLGDMLGKVEHGLSARTLRIAYDYCERRRLAYSPDVAVLGHGDAHGANTLVVPGSAPMQFKFIDPEGLFIEREYDAAVCMRGYGAELLAGDAAALTRQRLDLLSSLAGVDPAATWEWGFVERITTGLLLRFLKSEAIAEEYLSVAELWSAMVA